jgi:hypothetical protein
VFTILLIGHFIDIYSLKLHLIAGIYIKAVYNKVYKKTSFDIMDIFKQLAVGLHHGTSSKVFKRSREVLFSNS